ncbi:MlaC/ttg2D family ABC transporter substrate-binding protein [Nitrococcus mobilis]|uniref:Putative signal peptide protein n=1 Tax=Nitrococcus mobilis Nb-231 TaxID=314278 RepID=A4BR89_9GAMM|nr:ABC transporter substrate-binding protein [Nitrococcus mobilis]EAR21711.1 putative signal peptide protein [Nitrococcus mobilis Nb-231]
MDSIAGQSRSRRILALASALWLFAAIHLSALATTKPLPPDQLIMQTTEEVLKLLKAHQDKLKEHPERIYEQVKDLVIPHFDFELMSRFVLAQNWRSASPEQRARFVKEFRALLVQTYGYSLSEYSGQTVRFEGMQPSSPDNRVMVRTVIEQPDGPDLPVNYRLHKTAAGWKVYDVSVNYSSLVQTYRSSFRAQIRQEGLDRFLDELQQRNTRMVPPVSSER